MKKGKLFVLLCAALILTGCKSIPVGELNQYNAAFGEVQNVSETILLDYDQALKESRRIVKQSEANDETPAAVFVYAQSLAEFSKASGTKDASDILVRKQALTVVQNYNQALLELASGKSVEEIRSSTESFGNALLKFTESAAGSSFPGAGGVISLAGSVVSQIEKARLRREFETAIRNGAPLVVEILSGFIDDTDSHYEATVTIYNERVTLTVSEIVENLAEIDSLISGHAQPGGDFETVVDRTVTVNDVLAPLGTVLTNYGYPYMFESGQPVGEVKPPVYTVAVDVEIGSRIRAVTELVRTYQGQVDTVNALGAALENYRTLLKAAQKSLLALSDALESKQSAELFIEDLLSFSFEVKREIEAIRSASTAAP